MDAKIGGVPASESTSAGMIVAKDLGLTTLIIDRCTLFREGLREALAGTAFNVLAAVAGLKDVCLSDDGSGDPLLIVFTSVSNVADDLKVVKSAHARFPNSFIVALCRECHPRQAALMLQAGAAAILPVPQNAEGICDVLRLVILGQHVVPLPVIASCMSLGEARGTGALELSPPPGDAGDVDTKQSCLSAREIEIVQCLLSGEPNRSIARKLAICEATVKVHVKAILRKIKVKNRTQAAIWANNNMIRSAVPDSARRTPQLSVLP